MNKSKLLLLLLLWFFFLQINDNVIAASSKRKNESFCIFDEILLGRIECYYAIFGFELFPAAVHV